MRQRRNGLLRRVLVRTYRRSNTFCARLSNFVFWLQPHNRLLVDPSCPPPNGQVALKPHNEDIKHALDVLSFHYWRWFGMTA